MPSTFTIAELVRIARESKQVEFSQDVLFWGVSRDTYIPVGVISDAVSFVYSAGRTEVASAIYEDLYTTGKIQHWKDRSSLVIDFHNFSRGMAFAAITMAFKEVGIRINVNINSILIYYY